MGTRPSDKLSRSEFITFKLDLFMLPDSYFKFLFQSIFFAPLVAYRKVFFALNVMVQYYPVATQNKLSK
jgi:hypothetical protein